MCQFQRSFAKKLGYVEKLLGKIYQIFLGCSGGYALLKWAGQNVHSLLSQKEGNAGCKVEIIAIKINFFLSKELLRDTASDKRRVVLLER